MAGYWDKYDAKVWIFNFQLFRHIEPPGWRPSFKWPEDKVIWKMQGAEATLKGNCSRFMGFRPHSYHRPLAWSPVPSLANCCKGGILSTLNQNPVTYGSAFDLTVGFGTPTSAAVFPIPNNFTLWRPSAVQRLAEQVFGGQRLMLDTTYQHLGGKLHLYRHTGMFWGIQFYNDMLLQSGDYGNVQTEILLNKDPKMFTFREGWPFPRKISFDGKQCVLPALEDYPKLPITAAAVSAAASTGSLWIVAIAEDRRSINLT